MEIYQDEFLVYDMAAAQYMLTEKALLRIGIDLRARISADRTVSPENVIEFFLRTVSDMVYQFIHGYGYNNERQDAIILHDAQAREILRRAMEHQALYVLNVGNLYLSDKKEERAAAICELCRGTLMTKLQRFGFSLLFTGG